MGMVMIKGVRDDRVTLLECSLQGGWSDSQARVSELWLNSPELEVVELSHLPSWSSIECLLPGPAGKGSAATAGG